MAVPSTKLVYDFNRKFSAVLSGKDRNIPLVDKIAYLNEGQEIWFQNRVSVADTNQKVRNDLRVFKVDNHPLALEKKQNGMLFYAYPSDLYHRLNQYVVAKEPTCCGDIQKEFPIDILQADDIHESRQDVYNKASFPFEQLPAVEGSGGLILYLNDAFVVNDLIIDYYRRPKEIHAPELDNCQDEIGYYYDYQGRIIRQSQGFEADKTYASNVVVDIAVLCALRDVGNVQSFQTQVNKILSNQQIEK